MKPSRQGSSGGKSHRLYSIYKDGDGALLSVGLGGNAHHNDTICFERGYPRKLPTEKSQYTSDLQ